MWRFTVFTGHKAASIEDILFPIAKEIKGLTQLVRICAFHTEVNKTNLGCTITAKKKKKKIAIFFFKINIETTIINHDSFITLAETYFIATSTLNKQYVNSSKYNLK